MSSRILKDSILTDKAFNTLSLIEESIYHRLTVSADDYGIFYADPVLLLRILFPRKKDISEEDIREGLDHLEETGLIFRYTADGEDYLKISSWENDQRPRNTRHKFPCPETVEEAPVLPAEEEKEKVPEPPSAEQILIDLPLNDNTVYNVTQAEVTEYASLFPAVNVLQEYRNIKAWLLSHPERRKNRKNIPGLITYWLTNAQNKSGKNPSPARKLYPENPFIDQLEAEAILNNQQKNNNPVPQEVNEPDGHE